jgi:hypothetical protein
MAKLQKCHQSRAATAVCQNQLCPIELALSGCRLIDADQTTLLRKMRIPAPFTATGSFISSGALFYKN